MVVGQGRISLLPSDIALASWAAGDARIIGIWEVGGGWEDQVLVLSRAQSTEFIYIGDGIPAVRDRKKCAELANKLPAKR